MELVNSIVHFFTDNTRKLSNKVLASIILLFVIVFLDNTLSFSYYYNVKNKIEEVNRINIILKDSTLEEENRNFLLVLKKDIIRRKTWKDKSWDFFTNLNFKKDSVNIIKYEVADINNVKTKKIKIERSYILHYITSNWFVIIIMVIMPFVLFFDEENSFINALTITVFLEVVLYGISWINAKFLSYIPVIFNNPIYNYILNVLIVLLVIFLFFL